jgi:hypothetical protein
MRSRGKKSVSWLRLACISLTVTGISKTNVYNDESTPNEICRNNYVVVAEYERRGGC